MPGVDWLPGVSQLKSAVQLACGDVEGAKKTQINFFEECPAISQATSLGQLITGNKEAALVTQKKCLSTVNNFTNGIPIIGHIKGPGAISAGIAAGALYDSAGTVLSGRRQGLYAAIDKAVGDPNAPNIFEAILVPLFDGMGGYAGGKLTTSNVVQLTSSNLEALQLALDEITFVTAQSTAEQFLKIATRIKLVKEQIDLLKHGGMFWFDANTGGIFATNPSSSAIPGYLEKVDEKEMEAKIRESYNRQRDAILSDEYSDPITKGSAKIAKEAHNHKHQTAQSCLFHIYPTIPICTKEEICGMRLEGKTAQELGSLSWLLVQMPEEFNYTCVIMKNQPRQGLLHSFLRRSKEWTNVIPGISEDIQNISIDQELLDIGNASDPGTAFSLLNAFDVPLQKMNKNERESLEDVQVQLYNFINTNIKKAKYLGEKINDTGRLHVFFKIKSGRDNAQIMTVCPSNELYLSESRIPDSRPIRTITTVFFKSRAKRPLNRKIC